MDETKIRQYVSEKCRAQKSGKLLPLMMPTFGEDEILEAFDSLTSFQVTMGKKVERFEGDFSRYIGCKNSMMVNSGSSANLLALSILSNPEVKNRILPGDEILVPAVTWSTSIFPIINIGAKPVLADVDSDFLMDTEKLEGLISDRTRAIMPVHLLGNVCDMGAISDLAEDKDLFVIEDTCEALGSEYRGKKAGSLSDISTFSFYFSHHITTIEGGMMCTSNFDYADLAKIMRAHGYTRHSLKRKDYENQNSDIDKRFLFVNLGYNFRPTEIQGAFGIHQLRKLDGFLQRRTAVAHSLLKKLAPYRDYLSLPREKPGTRHSWFAFGITVNDNKYFKRNDLMEYLEKNGIETRPLVCGNFAEQPVMKMFAHKKGGLENAENVMRNSLYIGIHPSVGEETVEKVGEVFGRFFSGLKA